jgi:uncharacterized protein DUF1737
VKLYRYLTGPDDARFCHRVTTELNKGLQRYGLELSLCACLVSKSRALPLHPGDRKSLFILYAGR